MGILIHMSNVRVNEQFASLITVSIPLAQSSEKLSGNMTEALAALRGQIILGSDESEQARFKQLQSDNWSNVDRILPDLQTSAEHLGYSNIKLKELESDLHLLKEKTLAASAIANTSDNQPALKLLVEQAFPIATKMLRTQDQMIELESELEADEDRKALLRYLAESQTAFAISMGSLRAYLLTKDSAQENTFNQYWLKNTDALEYLIDDYEEFFTDAQLKLWEEYLKQRELFAPLTIRIFEAEGKEDANRANFILSKDIEPLLSQVKNQLQELQGFIDGVVDEANIHVAEAEQQVTTVLISVTLLVVALILFISFYIVSYLNKNINLIGKRAESIAKGDLTFDSRSKGKPSKDEFKHLMSNINDMASSLAHVVHEISDKYKLVQLSSQKVSTFSGEIGAVAERGKKNHIEVNQSITQFKELLDTSNQIVEENETQVKASQSHAESGIEAINTNMLEMRTTSKVVEQAMDKVNTLKKASDQIAQVTQSIQLVADQTNLISLNAAIEAARAGENGRGFAVVAEEVRNLAKRTSSSTSEIEEVILNLKSIVDSVATTMQEIIHQVSISQQRSQEGEEAIQKMACSIEHVSVSNRLICENANAQISQMDDLRIKLEALFNSLSENAQKAQQVNQIGEDLGLSSNAVKQSLEYFIVTDSSSSLSKLLNTSKGPISASV